MKLNLENELLIGKSVRIQSRGHYRQEVKDKIGVIEKISGSSIGVHIDGMKNKASSYGIFWFKIYEIKILDSEELKYDEDWLKLFNELVESINNCINRKNYLEEKGMLKMKRELEGFEKVANVDIDGKIYSYALYDDNIEEGDCVAVTGMAEGHIFNVVSVVPAEVVSVPITEEVVGKLNLAAYNERCDKRAKQEELRKKLNERRKKIEAGELDDMYAAKDLVYAELLGQMRSL